jgi:hypothetical protein
MKRLGHARYEQWWEVDTSKDSRDLAGEVVEAIRTYAIPEMRERLV